VLEDDIEGVKMLLERIRGVLKSELKRYESSQEFCAVYLIANDRHLRTFSFLDHLSIKPLSLISSFYRSYRHVVMLPISLTLCHPILYLGDAYPFS
jgi:hypothetical protein